MTWRASPNVEYNDEQSDFDDRQPSDDMEIDVRDLELYDGSLPFAQLKQVGRKFASTRRLSLKVNTISRKSSGKASFEKVPPHSPALKRYSNPH